MNNVSEEARHRAWFVEFLTWYLEGDLDGPDDPQPRNPFMLSDLLTEEEAVGLQSLMDDPPEHLDPSEIPKRVLVPLADLLALATEMDWALARAMVGERSRMVAADNRPSG